MATLSWVSRSLVVWVALVIAPAVAHADVRLHDCVISLGGARAVVNGTISPSIRLSARIALGSARIDATASGSLASLDVRGTLHAAGIAIPFSGHASPRAHRIDSLVATVLGADVSIDPVTLHLDAPNEIALHVRGLPLQRVLPDKLQATGVLDGEIAIAIDAHGAALRTGELHARAPGRLRVTDTSWLPDGEGVKHRLAATLADFAYAQLAIALAPRGDDPDVQLAIRGRGTTIAQDLDLVINVHGVRDVVPRLVPRVWRSS